MFNSKGMSINGSGLARCLQLQKWRANSSGKCQREKEAGRARIYEGGDTSGESTIRDRDSYRERRSHRNRMRRYLFGWIVVLIRSDLEVSVRRWSQTENLLSPPYSVAPLEVFKLHHLFIHLVSRATQSRCWSGADSPAQDYQD